jgi:hypothetical protein
VTLVDRFKHRLAQPLLALRREQQPLGEVPGPRARRGEQGDDHGPAHHPGRVLAVADLDEGGESLLAAGAAEVDRGGEQAAQLVRRHRAAVAPGPEVGTPDRQPHRVGFVGAGRVQELAERD